MERGTTTPPCAVIPGKGENRLDVGISSIILFKKNQRRGGIFPPRRLIFIITDIFRNISVIFYPICFFPYTVLYNV